MFPPGNRVLRGLITYLLGHAYILCHDHTDYIDYGKEQLGLDKSIDVGVGNGP
jgi:hypothetical protein